MDVPVHLCHSSGRGFPRPFFMSFRCRFDASLRSLLARVTPAGRESEIFGLWATTGRAASFISPALFGVFVTIAGMQLWGILGIVVVLVVGLVLMLLVKLPDLRPADPAAVPGSLS